MQKDDRTNPHWARTPAGKFHRLLITDPVKLRLDGQSGIIVLWHGGLKPKWIYVDKSKNIASDLDAYMDNDEIMEYERRGGVFVSWALVRPEYQDGVLKYLLESMSPLVDHPNPPKKSVEALPVLAPGQNLKQ
ncbi:MAG: hypothetical protein ISR45_07165 [Rhodospirillales bacterium]|nr:hypothetical protein [Rhodospirillales bacterium]